MFSRALLNPEVGSFFVWHFVAWTNETTGSDFLKRYSVIEISLPSNELRSKSYWLASFETWGYVFKIPLSMKTRPMSRLQPCVSKIYLSSLRALILTISYLWLRHTMLNLRQSGRIFSIELKESNSGTLMWGANLKSISFGWMPRII